MIEARYRGPEELNYKQADFSELKYIKIIYKDMDDETHEFKTEVNFMSDNYLSLMVRRKRPNTEEEPQEEIELLGEEDESSDSARLYYEEYLKKLAEIKEAKETASITGNYDEYYKRLSELKEAPEEERKKREKEEEKELSEEELKELEEKEVRQYAVECPQRVLLKFVIGELLYVATAELRDVKIKTTKVYFNFTAPVVLKLQQHRRFYRIDLKRLCLLVATNKQGSAEAFVARSINLSAGGVLINRLESATDGRLTMLNGEDYDKFQIIIVLEMDKVLKLQARYVREEQGRKYWRYAFEFINIPEEKVNFISKYVIGKQIEELNEEFNIKNKKILQRTRR